MLFLFLLSSAQAMVSVSRALSNHYMNPNLRPPGPS